MQSDKYALTFIASRIDNPAVQRLDSEISEARETVFTNLYGLRGVAQVGDFATLGVTYVNANHGNSRLSVEENSLKGVLGDA